MYNSIITSSCLFGSVYIFSESLKLINDLFLEPNIKYGLFIINSLTLVISGSIFLYSVKTVIIL
jgi:hypothetical protein